MVFYILQTWTNPIIRKVSTNYSIIGRSVLVLKENMLKNKNDLS